MTIGVRLGLICIVRRMAPTLSLSSLAAAAVGRVRAIRSSAAGGSIRSRPLRSTCGSGSLADMSSRGSFACSTSRRVSPNSLEASAEGRRGGARLVAATARDLGGEQRVALRRAELRGLRRMVLAFAVVLGRGLARHQIGEVQGLLDRRQGCRRRILRLVGVGHHAPRSKPTRAAPLCRRSQNNRLLTKSTLQVEAGE